MAENKAETVSRPLFVSLNKALYQLKASGLQLYFTIYR